MLRTYDAVDFSIQLLSNYNAIASRPHHQTLELVIFQTVQLDKPIRVDNIIHALSGDTKCKMDESHSCTTFTLFMA